MQSWLAIDDTELHPRWANALAARGHVRARTPAQAELAVVDAAGLAALDGARPGWVLAVAASPEQAEALLAEGADDVSFGGPEQAAARLAVAERALAQRAGPELAPMRGLLRATTDACLRLRDRKKLLENVCEAALRQGFAGARIDLWDPLRRSLVPAAVRGDAPAATPAILQTRPATGDLLRAATGDAEGLLTAALRRGLRPMGAVVLRPGAYAPVDPRERPLVEDLAADLSLALELIEEEERRREAAEDLRARERRQAALAHLGQDALSSEPEPLLREAVQLSAQAVSAELGRLLLKAEGRPALSTAAAYGFRSPPGDEPLTEGRSAAGHAFARGEPVLVERHGTDPRFAPSPELLAEAVVAGVHVVIPGGAGPLGTLEVLSTRERRFSDDEIHFLQTVAALVGGVLARRSADEALRRSEKLFRQLVEGSPEVICVVSEGRFAFVNPAMAATLGYGSVDALQGVKVDAVIHPAELATIGARLESARNTGRTNGPALLRARRADGSWASLETVSLAVAFEGVPALMAIGRDVTERQALQEQLKVAERLAAVGTLAAGVAHEINNPLAYVISNQAYLAEELDGLERELSPAHRERLGSMREALGEAQEGARRVRHIVRDMKTFSRSGDERPGPVDVRAVLESSTNIAGNEIRQRARLVRELAEVPRVEADAGKLGQVFLNLLVNAAQAIPEGSPGQHQVSVRCQPVAGKVMVEIEDSGVGIPAEVLPRIFDPFFTTKPVGVGTGLGLSICHGIVSRLGGELQVQSEPGRGSCFRILLPAAEQPRDAEAGALGTPGPSRAGRILVIDDEPRIGVAIQRALQPEHQVVAEDSSPRALERLRQGERYDLVLCDLLMPELTGMDLHDLLAAERPELAARMVFLSGGAFTARAQAFLEEPGRTVLEKPFDVEQLRAAVRRLLLTQPAP